MPHTILIADDSAAAREIFSVALERLGGYRTFQAENGAVALELTRRFRPDLILMDLAMPIMDGWAAAGALRISDPELPVVGVTAQSLVEPALNAALELFDDIVAKPVEPRELIAVVSRRLEGRAPYGEPPGLSPAGLA